MGAAVACGSVPVMALPAAALHTRLQDTKTFRSGKLVSQNQLHYKSVTRLTRVGGTAVPTAASMVAASDTAMVLLSPADIRGAVGSKPLLLSGPSTSCTAAVTSCRAAACAEAGGALLAVVGWASRAAGSSCDSVRKVAMLSMVGWSKACKGQQSHIVSPVRRAP